MSRIATLLGAAFLAAAPLAAQAVTPHAGLGDPRIREITYDPNQVVELTAVTGYQLIIELDPVERIENVAIGDSLGWQVTPNRKANLLFLKPMAKGATTNMTVVTNLRRYVFQLKVVANKPKSGIIAYSVKFNYPAPVVPIVTAPPPLVVPPPEDVNHAYSYSGSSKILPSRTFDDGKATYFQFQDDSDYPAIFVVEPDGGEAVINSHMRDGYVVVDRLAQAFVLRRGSEVTHLFNDGFHAAQPGPLSPKPRPKTGWFHR